MRTSLRWAAVCLLGLSVIVACEEAPGTSKPPAVATVNVPPPSTQAAGQPPSQDDASTTATVLEPRAAATNAPSSSANDPSKPPTLLPNGMLSPSDVLAVVRAQTPIVKKNCWDGDAGALQAATVRLSLTVGLSGNVQNASAVGEEPVASCIAAAASTWTFPAPQSDTPVNIPFRFVKR